MIFERAAAYVLVLVCIFQLFHPARMSRSQSWKSIDLRIGCLRVQASNCTDPGRFNKWQAVNNQEASGEARIFRLSCERRDGKRLRISITDHGCIAALLDETSDRWSISTPRRSD